MDITRVLGLVPVLGAAFRKDETKSEYDLAAGAGAAIVALPDCPGWVKAAALGFVAAAYIWSRTSKKNAEAAHA